MTEKKEEVKKEEIKVTTPTPRMLKLVTGEQVISIMYITEGSDFIRLSDPYRIELHQFEADPTGYYTEERMSLKPWVFQSVDKIYSIHKNNIITISMPTEPIKTYYDNIRTGKFPQNGAQKKDIEPIKPMANPIDFENLIDNLRDDEYYDMIQHLKGKKTIH
jgi:hypothetical protein